MAERFGFYSFSLPSCIWVHTVSVGETIAAAPLVKALRERYPHLPVLVTTMTPTGSAQVKKLFGESVRHVYVPYDFSGAVKRFLRAMQPKVAIIMETELWPNQFHYCQRKAIPICMLNARLSEQSFKGYRRIKWLTKAMLKNVSVIAAHAKQDAQRLIDLGANRNNVVATGSIKFDMQLPLKIVEQYTELRHQLGHERFIWVAASTHEGEDEIILRAHRKLRAFCHDALLILVPRHPDRFDAVAKTSARLFNTVRRSTRSLCDSETAVYLGDTMGELLMLFGAADVAFVGGSLIPHGGHNLLEPAALARPVITGPYLANFKEISRLLLAKNALIKVDDGDALANAVIKLYQKPATRQLLGENAKAVLDANRGALGRQMELVGKVLKEV